MKLDITSIDGTKSGSLDLDKDIFGLEPRQDLIARMIRYQLAKRRAGTHKTKGRAEIWRTGKKMFKQKGTGSARHGSARVPQFRGGGRAFGPVVRDHSHALPKKVRALCLRHALSAKARDGGIVIWESGHAAEPLDEFSTRHHRLAHARTVGRSMIYAEKTNASPLKSTLIVVPAAYPPRRISSASGFWISRKMARRSGRAPYAGS